MVIKDLAASVEKILTDAGHANAKFESGIIMHSVFGFDALGLIMNSKTEAAPDKTETALHYARRYASNEPLEYIIGTQEFMSLEFDVNPSVLIPRADTETLVERIIAECKSAAKPVRILDIGAGSGCIGISIAHYTDNTQITEIDISETALETAQKNAVKNGVDKRIKFIRCDILNEMPDISEGLFDIVVSNPPYIETAVIDTLDSNVRDFEPHTALDGGDDGLIFYRRITGIAPQILTAGGILAYEIGYDQGGSVSALMQNDFDSIEVIKDLCGNDRVVIGKLK